MAHRTMDGDPIASVSHWLKLVLAWLVFVGIIVAAGPGRFTYLVTVSWAAVLMVVAPGIRPQLVALGQRYLN